MISKNYDQFSLERLCSNCKEQPCCTGFAPPLLFSQDIKNLEKIGKNSKNYVKQIQIKDLPVKVLQKKKNSQSCIFWDEEKSECSIYSQRPFDCRMYPFDIFLIENNYYWIVYSCNSSSDWTWCNQHLDELENEPQFIQILRNIEVFSDLGFLNNLSQDEKKPFTILRKVNFSKKEINQIVNV